MSTSPRLIIALQKVHGISPSGLWAQSNLCASKSAYLTTSLHGRKGHFSLISVIRFRTTLQGGLISSVGTKAVRQSGHVRPDCCAAIHRLIQMRQNKCSHSFNITGSSSSSAQTEHVINGVQYVLNSPKIKSTLIPI